MLLIIGTGVLAIVAVLLLCKLSEQKRKDEAYQRLADAAPKIAYRKASDKAYELYNVDRLLANRSERWD